MSKRRKKGDVVYVVRVGENAKENGFWGTIARTQVNNMENLFPCELECGDDRCVEWADIVRDSGKSSFHICECEMYESDKDYAEKRKKFHGIV
jgi:hypothetical protein